MAETSVIFKLKGDSKNLDGTIDKSAEKAKKLGSGLKTALAVGVTAAAVGFAAITKSAVDAYADYEQLIGGVETLFKESAGIVENYANNAYKTAGMSANEYMETVTSFSASLLQSLDGDTKKSAKIADTAITDMSDNANKMGTSIENIQNAYQGFAKQNYTMLDNLKLGYGGTKEEMQRLLKDAEKLSGQKYDISNLNEVFEAIHVVQTELGITGTTAKEAATTIQGSTAMMKASWSNLMTGLADDTQDFDGLLSNFIDSIDTMISNLLPVVKTVVASIFPMISGLLPEIASMIQQILPEIIGGITLILAGIIQVLPDIVNAFVNLIPQIVEQLLSML
ncbi:MAG: phage tail protein, partial [Coprobacillaceae bacterium]